ncbi:MAG: phosphotransferase [Actinomycetota bacterium]
MEIPTTLTAVSTDWMTEVLRGSGAIAADSAVTALEMADIGEGTGIFGEIGRATISTSASDGPSTVIVKMPCVEPENLAVAHALGIYEREIRFFEDVAPVTRLRIPTCHLAHLGDDGGFVLVLEDLALDYEMGDQVVGATLEQANNVVDALVGLHARWWESDAMADLAWLPVPDAPQYMAAVPGIYRTGLPVLVSDWADRVPGTAIDLAQALDPKFEALMVATGGAPQTFAHADTRLDNLFFERGGDGVAFIDFQLSLRGRGVTDLAYFIGTSVQQDVAAANWETHRRGWHTQLAAAGGDYSWDDAVGHYQECALYYLVGAMSLIGTFDSGNERGAAMTTAYTTRVCNHVVDAGCAAVLDRL